MFLVIIWTGKCFKGTKALLVMITKYENRGRFFRM